MPQTWQANFWRLCSYTTHRNAEELWFTRDANNTLRPTHVVIEKFGNQECDEILFVALNPPSELVPCTYRSPLWAACVHTVPLIPRYIVLTTSVHERSTYFRETHSHQQQNVSANVNMGMGFPWDSLLPSILHDNRRFVPIIQI